MIAARYLLLALANFSLIIAQCQIVESRNIEEVMQYLIHDPKETLFVWDIDNTIAELDSPAPHHIGSDKWFCCLVEEHIKNGKSKSEAVELVVPDYTKAQLTYDLRLLQPESKRIFQHLQDQKIRTIALTARNLELRERTHEQLAKIGVNFQEKAHVESLMLNKEKGIEYYKGIIFASGNDKGKILLHFLQREDALHYKKVVIVDDSHSNIHAIARSLGGHNDVDVVAIRYGYLDDQVQQYRNKRNAI